MNRTSINLLSVITIAILAASILLPAVAMVSDFTKGFKDGWQTSPDQATEIDHDMFDTSSHTPVKIVLQDNPLSANPSNQAKSIIQFDDGTKIGAVTRQTYIMMDDDKYGAGIRITTFICMLLEIVLFILSTYVIVRFVIHINKGIVFDIRNIKLLTRLGIYMLGISLLIVISGLAEDYAVSRLGLTVDGEVLTSMWTIPWSDLLFGMMALLMAQIWRRGIELKEEHELTI